jgi:hypothetical protein
MKRSQREKLFVWPQQSLIEFTDRLQLGLQFLVIFQPLLYLVPLVGPQAELFGFASGIADGQHPNAVTFSALTLGTTAAMADGTVQQRTTNDFRHRWETLGQFFPRSD